MRPALPLSATVPLAQPHKPCCSARCSFAPATRTQKSGCLSGAAVSKPCALSANLPRAPACNAVQLAVSGRAEPESACVHARPSWAEPNLLTNLQRGACAAPIAGGGADSKGFNTHNYVQYPSACRDRRVGPERGGRGCQLDSGTLPCGTCILSFTRMHAPSAAWHARGQRARARLSCAINTRGEIGEKVTRKERNNSGRSS